MYFISWQKGAKPSFTDYRHDKGQSSFIFKPRITPNQHTHPSTDFFTAVICTYRKRAKRFAYGLRAGYTQVQTENYHQINFIYFCLLFFII